MIDDSRFSRSTGRPALPPEFSVVPALPPKKDRTPHDFMYRTASRTVGAQYESVPGKNKYIPDKRSVHKFKDNEFTYSNGLNTCGLFPIHPHSGCARVCISGSTLQTSCFPELLFSFKVMRPNYLRPSMDFTKTRSRVIELHGRWAACWGHVSGFQSHKTCPFPLQVKYPVLPRIAVLAREQPWPIG